MGWLGVLFAFLAISMIGAVVERIDCYLLGRRKAKSAPREDCVDPREIILPRRISDHLNGPAKYSSQGLQDFDFWSPWTTTPSPFLAGCMAARSAAVDTDRTARQAIEAARDWRSDLQRSTQRDPS
tara:strand:- start:1924 stop:2301 length:378 start_codon:yes stop_codon:yes gene_type:complete